MDTLKMFVAGIAAVGLIGMVIYAEVLDQRAWNAYAASHHCVRKGVKEGQFVPGYDSKGRYTTSYEPSQNIYVCDGGEIIIR